MTFIYIAMCSLLLVGAAADSGKFRVRPVIISDGNPWPQLIHVNFSLATTESELDVNQSYIAIFSVFSNSPHLSVNTTAESTPFYRKNENAASGTFDIQVEQVPQSLNVLTGNLTAVVTCVSTLPPTSLCTDIEKTITLVQEAKKLTVDVGYEVNSTDDIAVVSVTVSKDRETLEELNLQAQLHSLQGSALGDPVPVPVKLGSTISSVETRFESVPVGDYYLTVDYDPEHPLSDESLKSWIILPKKHLVPVHRLTFEIVQELRAQVNALEQLYQEHVLWVKCVRLSCLHGDCDENATNCMCDKGWRGARCNIEDPSSNVTDSTTPAPAVPTTVSIVTTETPAESTDNSTKPPDVSSNNSTTAGAPAVSTDNSTTAETPAESTDNSTTAEAPATTTVSQAAPTNTSPAPTSSAVILSTRYMEVAVGGFVVLLVLAVLVYLLYHHWTKLKEWVCSNKKVISHLPRFRTARGGRYAKLPRTMQEALHQD